MTLISNFPQLLRLFLAQFSATVYDIWICKCLNFNSPMLSMVWNILTAVSIKFMEYVIHENPLLLVWNVGFCMSNFWNNCCLQWEILATLEKKKCYLYRFKTLNVRNVPAVKRWKFYYCKKQWFNILDTVRVIQVC